jgi:hypothetical protein
MIRRALGTALIASAAIAAGAAAPPAASSDGLPVPGGIAPSGPLSDGQSHYMTRSKAGRTTVSRVEDPTGRVKASSLLPGTFTVPVVSLDGSPSGLSANGRALTLIRPRSGIPQAKTRLAVLNATSLRLHDVITLHGDFSFDAISPDGSRVYLIQYVSPTDPTRYAVRAYDVDAGRLLPDPIVDPDEHAGEMRGQPLARAYSPDGRWAYTLYDGAGKKPFVHALDTVAGEAVCVDTPSLEGYGYNALHRLKLGVSSDGSSFDVVDRGSPVATVDTGTFEVSTPTPSASISSGGGLPWSTIAVALALVAVAAASGLWFTARRRHRQPVAGDVT